MGYAVMNQKLLTGCRPLPSDGKDLGQALLVLLFVPEILHHVSRGVRWDSDLWCRERVLIASHKSWCASTSLSVCISDWTISTRASTASRRG
jgi:hypothetical protein